MNKDKLDCLRDGCSNEADNNLTCAYCLGAWCSRECYHANLTGTGHLPACRESASDEEKFVDSVFPEDTQKEAQESANVNSDAMRRQFDGRIRYIGDRLDGRPSTGITATGKHTLKRVPDSAIVTVRIVSEESTVDRAEAEVAGVYERAVAGAMAKLRRLPVEIEYSNIRLEPRYAQGTDGVLRQRGYRATQTIEIWTSVVDRAGKIIGTITRLGGDAVRIGGVRFELRDKASAEEEALEMATRNAIKKAKIMARAAGIKSWSIAAITETAHTGYYQPYRLESAPMMGQRSGVSRPSVDVSPGKIDVTAQTQVRLEI